MTGQDSGSGDDGARSVRSRKDRLASLRSRHQDLAQPQAAQAPAPSAPAARLGAGGPAWLTGQKGGKRSGPLLNDGQKQLVGRLYRMLTQEADDGSGLVPGTPFTRSGVQRLMVLLAQRAGEEGAPGSKVAESALRFIEAKEGEDEAVAGASLAKLQMLAQRAESFRLKGNRRPTA